MLLQASVLHGEDNCYRVKMLEKLLEHTAFISFSFFVLQQRKCLSDNSRAETFRTAGTRNSISDDLQQCMGRREYRI